ncbi:MAG: hypothetical protein JWL77_2782 [Chthonomonadaceae bacterium]|nr:hypothetical protein [Chthonomonadaceae bacterium]
MQTFRLYRDWNRWVSTLVVVAGGTALLPWQLKAQTQAPTQAPKEAQSGSFAQKTIDNRTIQLGEYSLKLVDAGKQQGGFVSAPLQGTANPFRPNLTFSLDITAGSKDNLMLLQGVENLHGLDDKGRVVRGADRPSFSGQPFGRAQDEGLRRETLSLQTEDGAKSLKTLEGNLLMEIGAARTFTFSAEELRPNTSKKMGQVTVTIDFAKEEPGDTWMYVTYLSPHFNPPRNAVDPRRPMFYSGMRMKVEVVGTDGVTYRPNSQGEMGGGSPQRVLPGGIDDGAPSISITKSHLSLGFHSIPEGVHLKSVVFRIAEQQGDVVSVPFKFTNVPLPEKP